MGLCLVMSQPAASQSSVTFDLDTGTPALGTGQSVPFSQAAGGMTAQFSSPSGSVFSIQTDASTTFHMSRFSGHYLYDGNQNRNLLDIRFSQPIVSISLTFATADFQQVEVPTTIQIAAYVDSTGTVPVQTASAHGTYAQDTMPMDTLNLTSGGKPFNLVQIGIPFQPLGATVFLVDNIVVTLAPPQTHTFSDEALYLAALTSQGSTAIQENFESDAAWAPSRNPAAAPSALSNGIIWSSNHPYARTTPDGISTSGGAAHSGAWGAVSSPHGNPDALNPTDPSQDGVMGTRVPGANLLYGVGCWVSGNLGGHLVMVPDGDATRAFDLGAFSTAWQYFGFTSITGFSRFEIRDSQGIVSESRYVFVDDCTLGTQPPATSAANVSSASFLLFPPQAAGAISSSFGLGLASAPQAAAPPLPATLANSIVTVKDSAGLQQPAALYYASPGQINFVIPANAAAGAASVSVAVGGQVVATGPLLIQSVAPGIFTANMDGQGPPAAYTVTTAADGSQIGQWACACGAAPGSCVPAPIDLGPVSSQTVLMLFGTGIGGFSSLSAVTATIGGVAAQVVAAAPVAGAPGLDQVTVSVPAGLRGRGAADLVLTVDGMAANTVKLNFK